MMVDRAGRLWRLKGFLFHSLQARLPQRLHPYQPTYASILPTRQDLRLPLIILQCALLYHFISNHVGFIASTIGPSMVPTLSAKGDRVYISRLNRRGKGIKVGDLVDFEHPMVPGVGAIKRVVGLPGDFVVRDLEGQVEMDGDGLAKKGRKMMIQIPEGHCWLLGDNLPESRDSRTYGPLPVALIKGKVVAKVWPLSEATWIKSNLQPVMEDV